MINEYFEFQKENEQKYGKNTITFYNNGSFYEIFEVDNDREKLGYSSIVSKLCNIQLSRKNKNLETNSVNRLNPYLVGFPCHSADKFIQILVDKGYTIVIVDQFKNKTKFNRQQTNVINNITYDDGNNNTLNYIHSINIYKNKNILTDQYQYVYNYIFIDLLIGESMYNTYIYNDLNDIIQLINLQTQQYSPKQIIYKIECDKQFIINHSDMINFCLFEINNDKIFTLEYQNKLIQHYYKVGDSKPVEFIGLEFNSDILNVFTQVLYYLYDHDKRITSLMPVPKQEKKQQYLQLLNNTIQQLNIVDDKNKILYHKKYNSVIDVIDNTYTFGGKQLLLQQLYYPIIDAIKIQARYDNINAFLSLTAKQQSTIVQLLKESTNIQRQYSRLLISRKFIHMFNLFTNIQSIFSLYKFVFNIKSLCHLINADHFNQLQSLQSDLLNTFNINQLKYEIDIFNKGIHSDLDQQYDESVNNLKDINTVITNLNSIIGNNKQNIKLEQDIKLNYNLLITKSKYNLLIAKIKQICDNKQYSNMQYLFDIKHSQQNKGFLGLYNDYIQNLLDQKVKLLSIINDLQQKYYEQFVVEFTNKYGESIKNIHRTVSIIDLIQCHGNNSLKYKLICPKIIDNQQNQQINIKNCRHILIERINDAENYKGNSVILKNQGLLIYGLNGGGKSSLLKSVGINIILAQAGSFVPADSFEFSPFTKLFCRISGIDNLFKNQSSFDVEVTELSNILKYSDSKSLILGDEICRGTEIQSAISIVTAVICVLINNKVNFIFTTHLQQLYDIHYIIDFIRNQQLFVGYIDTQIINNKIIFNRTLIYDKPPILYGLEVAQITIQNPLFNNIAVSVRKSLVNKEPIISKYNSSLLVDKCFYCFHALNHINTNHLQVHHLVSQCKFSDNQSFIPSCDKNNLKNLIVLCKQHHIDIHNSTITNSDLQNYKNDIILDQSSVFTF